jgi:hypothetical protein
MKPIGLLAIFSFLAAAQSSVPRMPDGKPDLQGIWNAKNGTAAFDIEDHPNDQLGPATS